MEYYIHNTSRSVAHRLKRYEAASHRGLLQFLDGRRIVRGRPLVLGEEAYRKNLEAIKKAVSAGMLEVRTADGRLINPSSGEVHAPLPVPPLPIRVLDSVKNDPPSGNPMPIYPGGAVQSLPEPVEPAPVAVKTVVEDDDDVEVEHTESGSGAKKGSWKKGRR
jgi:hypothetical protein